MFVLCLSISPQSVRSKAKSKSTSDKSSPRTAAKRGGASSTRSGSKSGIRFCLELFEIIITMYIFFEVTMANSADDYFALSIVGDGSTGKSSIINAFKTEGFTPVYRQTIGIEFYEKTLQIRGDQQVALRLWDVGGQSIHSKNLDKYLSNSHVVFLVYDVTNVESFSNLDDWLRKVRSIGSTSKHIYLVGNKIDLYNLRQVTKMQHDRFVLENQLNGGLLLSARTGCLPDHDFFNSFYRFYSCFAPGENVVRTFYQVAAELVGVKLTAHELAFMDKVLKVHVEKGDEAIEGRTAFADEIEAEDLAAEKKKSVLGGGCNCVLS